MAPIFFWMLLSRSPTVHEQQVHFTISSYVLWFKFSEFLYELILLRNEGDKCRSFLVNYSIYCSKSFLSSQIFYSQEIFVFLTIQSMFCFIQHSWMIIKLGVSIESSNLQGASYGFVLKPSTNAVFHYFLADGSSESF